MVKDNAEQIASIEWTVYGKIRKIIRIGNSTKPDLEFEYTPDGHRAVKIVKPKNGSISIYTYYVRDAQGNIMATYTRNFSKTIDYANIAYSQINNKIIVKVGNSGFANFTRTFSNNAGLKTSLLNSVSTDVNLLKQFNPSLLLTYNGNSLTTALSNFSDIDYVKIMAGNEINFRSLCFCYNNRQQTNPNTLLNLKKALLHTNNGIQILMTYSYNNNPSNFQQLFDYVQSNSTNTYQGSDDVQDKIDFIKLYLLDENSQGLQMFYDNGEEVFNFDCDLLEQILNEAFQLDQELVFGAIADLEGIRNIFYNQSDYFECDLNKNTTDIIALLSNHSETVWNALLQSQNAAYWLTWLKDNDPDFLYHAAFKYPNLVSTYQTNNNLYGGAYNGKQNYFVNLRNGLGQSVFDQIIAEFTGQSSLYIDSMNLSEWHIYGSSRIGIYQTNINLVYRNLRIVQGAATDSTSAFLANNNYALFTLERGAKRYELTNHLGNVLVVVSDKKIQVCSTNVVSYYTADVVSATDYSPFGAPLAGRTFTAPNISYRFSFNGKELDKGDEGMGGSGSTYDYGFRIYNAQIGRFLSVDPLTAKFPWWSPYHFAGNTPIQAIDQDGLETSFDLYLDRKDKAYLGIGTDKEATAAYEKGMVRGMAIGTSVFALYIAGSAAIPYLLQLGSRAILWSSARPDLIVGLGGLTASLIDPSPNSDYPGGLDDVARGVNLLFKKNGTSRFLLNTSKFDYFFGKVKAGVNATKEQMSNAFKSAERCGIFEKLGIKDNKEGRTKLTELFNKALESGKETGKVVTEYGTTVVKQVEVNNGDVKGTINVSFFYKGNDMTSTPTIATAVPKITNP